MEFKGATGTIVALGELDLTYVVGFYFYRRHQFERREPHHGSCLCRLEKFNEKYCRDLQELRVRELQSA